MAIDPRDVPITREDVAGWLDEYTPKLGSIRDYLTAKVESVVGDMEVNTSAHDGLSTSTPVVDMILNDLPSYGFDA